MSVPSSLLQIQETYSKTLEGKVASLTAEVAEVCVFAPMCLHVYVYGYMETYSKTLEGKVASLTAEVAEVCVFTPMCLCVVHMRIYMVIWRHTAKRWKIKWRASP